MWYNSVNMNSLEINFSDSESLSFREQFKSPYFKIVDEDTSVNIITEIQDRGMKVVVVEAVMDIPHYRHADYLRQSRNLGDFLIVRLNSDELIKNRKDSRGPIVEFENRAKHLAHYPYVDLITSKNDIGKGWLTKYHPDIVIKSVTSGVGIMEEALSMIPEFNNLGINMVIMDQFANPIPLSDYKKLTVEYSENKFGLDKFSGSIIKQRLYGRFSTNL